MRLIRLLEWLSRHRPFVDAVLAAALFAFFLTTFNEAVEPAHARWFGLVMFGALAWRRRWPAAVLAVVIMAHLLEWATVLHRGSPLPGGVYLPTLENLSVAFALYAAARYSGHRWIRVGALAAAWVGAAMAVAAVPATGGNEDLRWQARGTTYLLFAGPLTVIWLIADILRHRSTVAARLAQQQHTLDHDRAQRERLAVQQERARIAREMHDVVAHNLSVIVVQADGAEYLAALDPTGAAEGSAQALETIATTARSALADTRRLVGVLRDSDRLAEYRPTQTLGDVDALVADVVARGLDVTLEHHGLPGPVAAEVGLAAYRIVQESLTNAIKHAGHRCRVTVVIDHKDPLVVTVGNTLSAGTPAIPDTPGHGLIGMGERADAVGGDLQAGPTADGGFQVVAVLPTRPAKITPGSDASAPACL